MGTNQNSKLEYESFFLHKALPKFFDKSILLKTYYDNAQKSQASH